MVNNEVITRRIKDQGFIEEEKIETDQQEDD